MGIKILHYSFVAYKYGMAGAMEKFVYLWKATTCSFQNMKAFFLYLLPFQGYSHLFGINHNIF